MYQTPQSREVVNLGGATALTRSVKNRLEALSLATCALTAKRYLVPSDHDNITSQNTEQHVVLDVAMPEETAVETDYDDTRRDTPKPAPKARQRTKTQVSGFLPADILPVKIR